MRTSFRVNGRRRHVGLVLLLAHFYVGGCFAASEILVSDELASLAQEEDFVVEGDEQLGDASAWVDVDTEDVYQLLRALLEKFDHIILQDSDGEISRVIILGERTAIPAVERTDAEAQGPEDQVGEGKARIVLQTRRVGQQHSVDVGIETQSRGRLNKALVVDTGASLVVLPASLVKELGLDDTKLLEREIQTANGKINAQVGTLPGVWLGNRRENGVEAAFIDDDRLGGTGLLGMSVLGRYQVTIDDETQRLILTSKGD
jgi:aspartyl protease family protein